MCEFPSFPFYANDWLSSPSIFSMSAAARGAYITLLSRQWQLGSVPKASLPGLIFVSRREWNGIENEVLAHFDEDGDGLLTNEKLKVIRADLIERQESKRAAGRAGANARWNGNRIATASIPHMAKRWPSSSSSSSSSEKTLGRESYPPIEIDTPPEAQAHPEDARVRARSVPARNGGSHPTIQDIDWGKIEQAGVEPDPDLEEVCEWFRQHFGCNGKHDLVPTLQKLGTKPSDLPGWKACLDWHFKNRAKNPTLGDPRSFVRSRALLWRSVDEAFPGGYDPEAEIEAANQSVASEVAAGFRREAEEKRRLYE